MFRLALVLHLLLISFELQANEATLNIQSYIQEFTKQDNKLKSADLEVKIANSNKEISEDFYQSRIDIGPVQTNQEIKSTNATTGVVSETKTTTEKVSGDYTQLTPLGTEINFNVQDSPNLGFNSREYSVTLTQPLYRNSFGVLLTEQSKLAQKKLELAKLKYEQKEQESCLEAIKIFLGSYHNQERLSIFLESLKQSSEALKIARRAYRKKLLKKIELLSAEADHLKVQALVENAKSQYRNSQQNLALFSQSQHLESQLDNPENQFQNFSIKEEKIILKDNLSYQSGEKELLVNEIAVEVEKEKSKSDVLFSVQAGRKEGQQIDSTGGSFFTDEDFILFSLKWSWPVLNNTLKENVAKAIYKRGVSERRKDLITKELQSQFSEKKNEMLANEKLLKLSQQKVALYRKQMVEARRLLRAGKLEFEDYLRFRDFYLNERLESLRVSQKLWLEKSEITYLLNQKNKLCMDQV